MRVFGVLQTPDGRNLEAMVDDVHVLAEHRFIEWFEGVIQLLPGDAYKTLDLGGGYTLRCEQGIPPVIEGVVLMSIRTQVGRIAKIAGTGEIIVEGVTTEVGFRTVP